jgi:hypothetical protein
MLPSMMLAVLMLPGMLPHLSYTPLALFWRKFNLAFQRITDLLEYDITPKRSVHRRILRKTQKCIAKAHGYEYAGV